MFCSFASHTESWGWRIAAALAFSFVNNTIFALLHEAVHGLVHPRRAVNDAFGRLMAAFFPTGSAFSASVISVTTGGTVGRGAVRLLSSGDTGW